MSGVGSSAVAARPSRFRSFARRRLRKRVLAGRGRAYTRWLATHHYENFHVVSFLLPKRLHQDFYNVYSYCRWADDLATRSATRAESLRLLALVARRTGRHVRGPRHASGVRRADAHGARSTAFRGSRSPI